MKYVSPIYEVETIETEDIMGASMITIAESLGITVSGDKKNDAVTSVTLTTTVKGENGQDVTTETTDKTQANGVSIGINFGSLFGNN